MGVCIPRSCVDKRWQPQCVMEACGSLNMLETCFDRWIFQCLDTLRLLVEVGLGPSTIRRVSSGQSFDGGRSFDDWQANPKIFDLCGHDGKSR